MQMLTPSRPKVQPPGYPLLSSIPIHMAPSPPKSRLIKTLFGTGRSQDASAEQSLHGFDSMCHPILSAGVNALPGRPRSNLPLLNKPCPVSRSAGLSALAIPNKAKFRSLATKTLTLCKHQAMIDILQGFLKQPEPPACHRVSCSSYSSKIAVLFAAAHPPGGHHLTQLGPNLCSC